MDGWGGGILGGLAGASIWFIPLLIFGDEKELSNIIIFGGAFIICLSALIVRLLICFRDYGIDFPKYEDWVAKMVAKDEDLIMQDKARVEKAKAYNQASREGKKYFNSL